jgi:hypothetical protein
MFNINSYLEKFKRLEPPGDTVKTAAVRIIFETIGVKVEKNEMNVKDSILFLSVSSSVKNEVYMNKKAILEKTRVLLGSKELKDIR